MLTDKEIENGWIKIIKNNPPISRYGQCSGCYMNQHFSFGGDGISGYLSDLICFDFITHEWKEIELTGDIPEKRTGHSGGFITGFFCGIIFIPEITRGTRVVGVIAVLAFIGAGSAIYALYINANGWCSACKSLGCYLNKNWCEF